VTQRIAHARRLEHVATELVAWFNAVDATYRADLRELNELNFARFDAKLEQRLAALDGKWAGRWTELDAKLERRLAEFGAALRVEMAQGLSQLKSDLLRWMFGFWASTALALAALALRR
jgi:hypothetical protein